MFSYVYLYYWIGSHRLTLDLHRLIFMFVRNESIASLREESSHRKLDVLPIKSKFSRSKKGMRTTLFHLPNLSLRGKCHPSHRNVCVNFLQRNEGVCSCGMLPHRWPLCRSALSKFLQLRFTCGTESHTMRVLLSITYNTATKQVRNCSTETSYCHAPEFLS
jgi:hypothetical protein